MVVVGRTIVDMGRVCTNRVVSVALALAMSGAVASRAEAFPYPSLPEDNLVENAWFQEDCEWSIAGWQTAPEVSWGSSGKTQDPTDVNCQGNWWGFAARWARNSGATPEFSPNQDALLWQVVGPVDANDTVLSFHFLLVAHRFNRFKAEIYGSDTPDGPWTSVWVVLDEAWLDSGGASGPYTDACPGGMQDRDCWWDLTTEAELGSLDPLVQSLERGYPYYKIEFLGNYPEPSATATGDVGGKIARVYFNVFDDVPPDPGSDDGGGETNDSGEDDTTANGDGTGGGEGSTTSPNPSTTGDTDADVVSASDSDGAASDTDGCGCTSGSTPPPLLWLITLLALTYRRRRRASAV